MGRQNIKGKRQRFMSIVLVIAVAILLMSAGSPEAEPEVSSRPPATLRIIEKNPEWAPFWDEIIPIFQAEYPHITIQHEAVATGQYNQLLAARLASNDVDIAIGERRHQAATADQRSQWVSLSGQPYLERFSDDVIALGTVDGQAYMVPTGVVGNVVFYNVDRFEQLGLDVPDTWSEFLNVAESLQRNGTVPIVVGAGDTWPVNMIVNALEGPIVQGYNPDFYTDILDGRERFDRGPWMEVYRKLDTLSEYFQEFATGTPYDSVVTLFANGAAAMLIDGAWQAGPIDAVAPAFEVDVFAMPATDNPPANNVVTTKMATGYMINSQSENIEEAHLFMEFFSRPEIYQRFIAVSGLIPAQEGIRVSTPTISRVAEFFAETPQIPEWPDLRVAGADYSNPPNVIRMILGELTPQEVADQMQAKFVGSRERWRR